MDYFSEADKHQYRDEHFEEDKQMAFELGFLYYINRYNQKQVV